MKSTSSSREERLLKRNEKKSTAAAAIEDVKLDLDLDEAAAAMPPPDEETSIAISRDSPISIMYKSGNYGQPERQIVILPYMPDPYWQNPNIAYFQSSGTSNADCGWLCGTFFPTGGITTKIKEDQKTIGMNSECLGTEGHLLKMSDIIDLGVFIGIENFYLALAQEIESIVFSKAVFKIHPKPPEFDNYDAGPSIIQVFYAIDSYFISEQQLMLSYQLTQPNIGLWGWRFGNFTLADFCKRRWGEINHIRLPPVSALTKLNKEDTCNFIKENEASVNFEALSAECMRLQGKTKRLTCISKVVQIDSAFKMKDWGSMFKPGKGIRKRKNTKNKKKQHKRFKTKRK
jgi:hypothetical protein